jgi:hypothetical protein
MRAVRSPVSLTPTTGCACHSGGVGEPARPRRQPAAELRDLRERRGDGTLGALETHSETTHHHDLLAGVDELLGIGANSS